MKQAIWKILPQTDVDDALVLRTVEDGKVKMHVLEPDGTEADFCGNGARAVGMLLHKKYGKKFCLVSRKGEHRFMYKDGECFVDMGDPTLDKEELIINLQGRRYSFKFVDCIEPHLVTSDFCDPKLLKVLGDEINREYRERFLHGVNVNCYQKRDGNALEVLTYERGVYRLTGACGTGSTACVKVAIEQQEIRAEASVNIKVPGGELRVYQSNSHFWLGGPVILHDDDLISF